LLLGSSSERTTAFDLGNQITTRLYFEHDNYYVPLQYLELEADVIGTDYSSINFERYIYSYCLKRELRLYFNRKKRKNLCNLYNMCLQSDSELSEGIEVNLINSGYDDYDDREWDEPEEEPFCLDLDTDEDSNATWTDSEDESTSDEESESDSDDEDDELANNTTLSYMLIHETDSVRKAYIAVGSYHVDVMSFHSFVEEYTHEQGEMTMLLGILDFYEKKGYSFRPRGSLYNLELQSQFSFIVKSAIYGHYEDTTNEEIICLFEDVCTFVYIISTGEGSLKSKLPLAIAVFVKLRLKGSLYSQISDIITYCYDYVEECLSDGISEAVMQSENSSSYTQWFDNYDEICKSPFVNKVYKILFFLISICFYKKVSADFNMDLFRKCENDASKQGLFKGPDFIISLARTIIYICQRGYQCMVTGSLDPIYHCGDKYERWINEVIDTKRKHKFINNPEPHGFTKFEFMNSLERLISEGDAIHKHAIRIGDVEKRFIYSYLSDLKLIKATETTIHSAMKTREAPFALLVFGGSKIAKSQFTEVLFAHHAQLFDLPLEYHYKYVRSFADEYWTNFNSSQWCIQMDDVAFRHPNVAPNGDPTVMELLQVVNNVPYVPPQASLEDKGKNPVLASLVIATTNVPHLNALYYYNNELAVRRRLEYVLILKPKNEYSSDGVTLDPSKLPILEDGVYPDFWRIHVCTVVPATAEQTEQRGKFETLLRTEDINEFLLWYNEVSRKHVKHQKQAVSCTQQLRKVLLCDNCMVQISKCVCCKTCWKYPCICNTCAICNKIECVCNLHSRSIISWRLKLLLFIFYIWCRLVYYLPFLDRGLLGQRFTHHLMSSMGQSFAPIIARTIGNKVNSLIGTKSFLCKIVAGLSCTALTYKLFKCVWKKKVPGTPQSDGAPATANEGENLWKAPEYQVTTFDYNSPQLSLANYNRKQIEDHFSGNCVHFKITHILPDGKQQIVNTMAVCIVGHIYMVNKHALHFFDYADIEVISAIKQNVSANTRCIIHRDQIYEHMNSDLAFMCIDTLPSKKSIVEYFAKESLMADFPCIYVGRNGDGTVYTNTINKVSLYKGASNVHLKHTVDIWVGDSENQTKYGDCGALCIMRTNLGPAILGIHFLGNLDGKGIGAHRVTYETLQIVLNEFKEQFQPSKVNLYEDISKRTFSASLHYKSTIPFVEKGASYVFGSLTGFSGFSKSAVQDSLLKTSLIKRGLATNHVAPDLRDWRPWKRNIDAIYGCPNLFKKPIMDICVTAYVNDILKLLPKEELMLMQQLDDDTMLNGKNGIKFIDAINKNTSMGFPWCKSKRYYMAPLESTDPMKKDFIKMDPVVYQHMNEMVKKYRQHFLCHPIFVGSTKDDPITPEQAEIGKIRIFTVANVSYSLLVRKHFLAFVRVFQRNPFIFEGAPGMVAQSLQWEQLYEYLGIYDDLFDGDFKFYDKNIMAMCILSAFEVIIQLQNKAGQPDEDIRRGLAEDTAYPFVYFKGDLIQFFNGLCSGIPLTVIINCIAHSLYMRYCYYCIFGEVDTFKEKVRLITYGDDGVQSVHPSIRDKYNHVTVAEILAQHGMEYTMADKSSTITPFRTISQVTFLKRSFKWDENVGAIVAPLDEKSIYKMISVNMRSRTTSDEDVTMACVSSAVREMFFYGKEKFTTFRETLRQCVFESGLEKYITCVTFPTYGSLIADFWRNSKNININRKFIRPEFGGLSSWTAEPKPSISDFDLQQVELVYLDALRVLLDILIHQSVPRSTLIGMSWLIDTKSTTYGMFMDKNPIRDKEMSAETYILQADTVPLNSVPSLRGSSGAPAPSGPHLRGSAPSSIGGGSQGEPETQVESSSRVPPESIRQGNGGGYIGHRLVEESQTVKFIDDSLPNYEEYDIRNDPDSIVDTTVGMDLANYLSRPVQLGAVAWSSAGIAGASLITFNPWNDILLNANIQKKMEGWAFLRCTVRLKFMVNASPFLYGALRVGYTPLQNWRPRNYNFTSTVNSLIPFSQLPGGWIYPQSNQGFEMKLPFFSPLNLLDIRNTTGSTVDKIAPNDMGNIDVRIYAPLRSANGVAAPTTSVVVYGWLEDVILSGPTLSGVLQAKTEYTQEPYSKQATAVANAASLLKGIPVISPYATATEMGARALAAGLKTIGYSNPPVIDNQTAFRPTAFPPVASPEISYPIDKLSLDPKNELAIDPTLLGIDNVDELNINYLCSKESYLTSFTWSDADLVETNKLLMGICPSYMQQTTGVTGGTLVAATPMSWLSQLYNNWRGDIIIRVKVIASKFHKGRLRIAYDPAGVSTNNLITTTGPYEERVACTILDLEEDTDAEFVVPYQQAATWMRTATYTNVGVTPRIQTSAFNWSNVVTANVTNGALGIRVLTPLTGPASPTTVQILVSAHAGENFEFSNPLNDQIANIYLYGMQSQIINDESDQVGGDYIEEVVAGTIKKNPTPTRYLNYMGEANVTLRQLLRRMTLVSTNQLGFDAVNQRTVRYTRPRLPNGGGAIPNSTYLARNLAGTANISYSWEQGHAIPYIGSAFCGQRGSVNWSFNVSTEGTRPTILSSYRINYTGADFYTWTIVQNAGDDSAIQASVVARNEWVSRSNLLSGGTVTDISLQPTVNTQLPFYSRLKMWPSHPGVFINPGAATTNTYYQDVNAPVVEVKTFGNTGARLNQYCGIGSDFSFYFFLCVPLMYTYTTVPAGPV
jgi:hypothetical protein